MPSIRAMTSKDVESVMALAARSPDAPHWTSANYAPSEERPSLALIAEQNHALAGFVVAALVLDVCELASIVVAEAFRRQGIGATLLEAVVSWSRERAARRIELEVRASNQAAISLYERAGFLRDGLRRGYYYDPLEDAVLMSLTLHSAPIPVEKIP